MPGFGVEGDLRLRRGWPEHR